MCKTIIKKIIALLLCFICFGNSVYAQSSEEDTTSKLEVYYEIDNQSNSSPTSRKQTATGESSWATIVTNESLTVASVQVSINSRIYSFEAYGSTDKVKNGYVGFYQGYIVPSENDSLLQAFVMPDSLGVLVSVNAIFCEEDVFFTLVIGVILESQDPIVKEYGTHTEAIDAIIKMQASNMRDMYAERQLTDEIELKTQNMSIASVDATIRYKASENIYDSSNRHLGQVSLFHANQLKNQNSMSVYAKVNSNTTNANAYARNYFGLTSNDNSVVYPSKVGVTLSSNDNCLHIDGTNYKPKTGTTTITVPIPYYLNSSFGTIAANIRISSVKATTSGSSPHYNQKINWVINHSVGITGMDGTYTSQKGLPVYASYKYEGTVSSQKTAKLTASAYITYTVYVENAIYGTTTSYSFTTATKSCTGNVTILP